MLTTSRLIRIASLLSLIAAGCGGGSVAPPETRQDAASNADSGGVGSRVDGAAGFGTPDAGVDAGADAGPGADAGADAGPAVDAGADAGPGTPDAGGTAPDGGPKTMDGASCGANADCLNGHCVSGLCCATACDDGNMCTVDTCLPATGCAHDGTGVVMAGCMTADMCTSYHCAGDKAGTCDAVALIDCTGSGDQCNIGVCDATNGSCKKQASREGSPCQGGNACTVGEKCLSGACAGGTARNCNDNNPCTDDSCDMTLGCKNQNNTATCDDGNPCTVSDLCAAGVCKGSPKDCTAQNDACNVGVCTAGTCGKSAKANGTACDDSLACTATDVCTGGTCTGSGNSCGPNSSACAEGPPKVCTCNATYVSTGGLCVASTDPCVASPCVAGATCTGPSTCTCPTGFTGDGKASGTGCTNASCAGNPCGAGRGTCVDGINTHTCNCNQGYVSVNGVCVCDMNGTFASQLKLATSWSGITYFENAMNVPSTSWAIRTQSYDSTGKLVIQTTQCGGTSIDLCGNGIPFISPDEAYTQFLPSTIFGLPSMPVGSLTITLTNALPSQAYQEPPTAILFGISLTDPLGPWPAANINIGAGASQTNGAIWVDSDNDTHAGVTSYAVPPGGISHTTSPYPIQDYASTSSACPRGNVSAARLQYNYLPGIENLMLKRIKRVYTAQRVISSMSGTITSCDSTGATLIQGTLGGPDSGQVQASVRVGGCVRVNGAGEIDCDPQLTNFFDGQAQTQHVTSGSFVIKRAANTVTCADVRAMTFP